MDEDQDKIITDHEIIKQWAISRHGSPQAIDEPISTGDKVGIRINFPGTKDESYDILERVRDITWDEFFEIFEQNKLGVIFKEGDHNHAYEYFFIKRS